MNKTQLLREICHAYEAAFRRGFHHGVVSGACEQEAEDFRRYHMTQEEADSGLFKFATMPPWDGQPARPIGTGHTCFERMEMQTHGLEELSQLIRDERGNF